MLARRCARQTALKRQDLSCTHLPHHELESVYTVIIANNNNNILLLCLQGRIAGQAPAVKPTDRALSVLRLPVGEGCALAL